MTIWPDRLPGRHPRPHPQPYGKPPRTALIRKVKP
jgi:hypothetical protein